MFEFLPGAKPTDKQKVRVKRQSMDETLRRQRAAEASRPREKATILDGIGAVAVKGGIGFIDRFIEDLKAVPDPNFRLPKNFAEDMETWGIEREQWPLMQKAVSADHYAYLKTVALQNQYANQTLSQFSTLGQIGLGFTDPVAFGVDALTGGVGKGARILRGLRAGLTAATVNTGMLAASREYDPSVKLEDLATTAAASFAFAGVLGARKGKTVDHAGTVDPDHVARVARDENLSAAKVSNLPDDPTPGVMPLREGGFEQDFRDRALANAHLEPAFASVRRDLAARMGAMNAPEVREAGRVLFRDGVGYTDRSAAVAESAVEFARRHSAVFETEYRRAYNAAWADYRERTGTGWWNYMQRARFSEEVGLAIRGVEDVAPEAKRVASQVADVMERIAKLADESGLDGFAHVNNRNYLPRYWSSKGFRRIFGELGLDEQQVIQGLIKPAMRRAWEKNLEEGEVIDEELLEGVAKAWLKRAQANFEGDGMALHVRPMDMDDVDELAKMLEEAGVSPTRSAELLAKFERKAYDQGKTARAKKRIDLDETYETTLKNERGEDVRVGVYDLLDNDIESVMHRYIREMTGWSALAAKAGIKNASQLERFKNLVKTSARKAGDDETDVMRLVDIGLKATFGRSTEANPNSKASRLAGALLRWNFARVMNQVGFSLFAELGPTIAHAGLKNFISSTLAARGLLMRAADGQLESKEARVLEKLFAPGTDWLRNPPFLRLDEDGAVYASLGQGKAARMFDNAQNLAVHTTSVMSGMAPVNTMLQRIAGRATLLRLMDMAKAKKLSSATIKRLRTWGLDEKSQEEVFKVLRGVKRIEDINPDALPFQTREKMAAFLFRVTRHQVLESDPSDSIELMHSWAGKIVMQFRSFMVNSYTRHFLNSIYHYDDWRTYAMVTLSTAAAGMGWAARTYLNTIGDEEKRREQLTEENFIKNAVAQSSWSTIFPAIADMVWSDFKVGLYLGPKVQEAFGEDSLAAEVLGDGTTPIFRGNRSTGLDNGLKGIPTVDLLTSLYGFGTKIPAAILSDDVELTEKDMRNFWKIVWFNNMTGVRNLAHYAIEETFPEKEGEDDDDDEVPEGVMPDYNPDLDNASTE